MNIDLSICFFLLVNRYILTMSSCVMQIIGTPFFGDSVWRGVTINSFTSVVAMKFWGTLQLISSPLQSASKTLLQCYSGDILHLKSNHRQPVEGRLSIHYHPVPLHEMHMKHVSYINHGLVKFQRECLLSLMNIGYLCFSDEFFCQASV